MKNRQIALFCAAVFVLTLFAGCGKKLSTGKIGVSEYEEFGTIYIEPSIEEFNNLGFVFGDSVDVKFDNGKTIKDIPYYSGYYCPVGETLLCGYPGYAHPVIACNYGPSTWEEYGMTNDSKVTVTLNERGKYLEIQELYALIYSDLREDFDSDVVFANVREVVGGNLKRDAFYRSASPCDNQHNRAAYANALAEETGIRYVLNLSDNEDKYRALADADDFASFYYDSLKRDGKVLLMSLNANYRADAFAKTVADAFYAMTQNEGPCLIHCLEGKDRTGFVCALLLALADATADEILDDYMITYDNYYHVTPESNPKRYEAIRSIGADFLYCICDAEKGTDLSTLNLKKGAENYLRRGGLTDDQIAEIEAYIR